MELRSGCKKKKKGETSNVRSSAPFKNEDNISGQLGRIRVTAVHWRLWLMHEICWILGSIGLATGTFTLASICFRIRIDSPQPKG